MPNQTNLVVFKDPLPIPPTIFPPATPDPTIFIKMKPGMASLHSDLPLTPVWGYGGRFPGAIIEVNKGQTIHVLWKNRLTKPDGKEATLPVKVVVSDENTQSEAGDSNGWVDPDVSGISPVTVTHLHGAKTHPDSDGWTDNTTFINQSTLYTYENNDRASLYWYHDHAMGVTRLNVYAGLAGLYIVRDSEEFGLNLPKGKYEIPLVLQDRNLDVTASGNLNGKLLHKVEGTKGKKQDGTPIGVANGTMEFFGPFNLVNGKITPFLEVERAVYRFRLVNGCNGRTYKLKIYEDGTNAPFSTNILKQIGSDGGLFKKPITLQNNELILAPGERADVIADFRGVNLKGKKLNFVNTAIAPFDGNEVNFLGLNYKHLDNGQSEPNEFLPNSTNPNPNYNPSLAIRQKNASIMQFQIANVSSVTNNFTMPTTLSASFVRTTHANLPNNHEHRIIALVEEEIDALDLDGNPITDASNTPLKEPMLMLRELVELNTGETIPAGEFKLTFNSKNYKSIGSMFYDQINFKIRYGSTEVWKIINLTGDTHPFHVHLVQFQALGRQEISEDIPNLNTPGFPTSTTGSGSSSDPLRPLNSIGASDFNLTFVQATPDDALLDENEKGWKDTIRVNPKEMMTIAMTFDGYCGRYMYHCHLLEHEDREMMRPFVVLQDAIIDRMRMGGGHHH